MGCTKTGKYGRFDPQPCVYTVEKAEEHTIGGEGFTQSHLLGPKDSSHLFNPFQWPQHELLSAPSIFWKINTLIQRNDSLMVEFQWSQAWGGLPFSFSNQFIEVWLTYKKWYLLNVYITMSLGMFFRLWNHHHQQGHKRVHHLPKFPLVGDFDVAQLPISRHVRVEVQIGKFLLKIINWEIPWWGRALGTEEPPPSDNVESYLSPVILEKKGSLRNYLPYSLCSGKQQGTNVLLHLR